jgi:hypothetical protein
MLQSTTQRVTYNTAPEVNDEIRRRTEESIARCATAGPDAIARRLHELDEEWDIERYLETMAPTISLIGLCLGVTVSRKWLVIPAVVQSFLLMHALQGWCPPVPVLRRLGVRTLEEIDQERFALKALRGDFRDVPVGDGRMPANAVRAFQAAAAN